MKNYSETYKTVFTVLILVFLVAVAFVVACVGVGFCGGELTDGACALSNVCVGIVGILLIAAGVEKAAEKRK